MSRVLLLSAILSGTFLTAAPAPQAWRQTLVFEPNQGQFPAQANWVGRGPGYRLVLTSEGVTMMVREGVAANSSAKPKYSKLRMKLIGSRPWKDVSGIDPTGGVSNYFPGNDAGASRTNVPQFARIMVAGVYEGIDLVFYSHEGNLEYDFVVKPGADPAQIRLAFDGQERMLVDEKSGDVVLAIAGGREVRQICPKVYQQVGNKRVEVAGGYQLLKQGQVAFTLARYDPRQTLVIDPKVSFQKWWWASQRDEATAISVDSLGNAYITGWTESTDFLVGCGTVGCGDPSIKEQALQWDEGGTDAFLLKVSPLGTPIFATYLGGRGYDAASGIAVDSSGVYITGTTDSTDFPHQNAKKNTDRDVFVCKIRLDGEGRNYTTIVGGSRDDAGKAIALDPVTHWVAVTGVTTSNNFPNHYFFNGSLQVPYDGGAGDAFIFQLDASGAIFASVRIPGKGQDAGTGIALDPDGNVWIAGTTCSSDFPVRLPAPPTNPGPELYPNGCGGFAAKWQRLVSSLLFSTYLDGAKAVAVDAHGNAFVIGEHIKAYANEFESGPHIFVTKFSPAGAIVARKNVAWLWGENPQGNGIALNAAGEVYVTGYYGKLAPAESSGFVAKWSPDLQRNLFTLDTGHIGDANVGIAVYESLPPFSIPQVYIAATSFAGPDNKLATYWRDVWVYRVDDDPTSPTAGTMRLRNFSVQNEYINIQSGVPAVGTIQPGWLSAQWTITRQQPLPGDPAGQNVYLIQNRQSPNEYLNVESGFLQCTAIQPGSGSARWTFELQTNTNVFQIHNVGQPDKYLNIANGLLTAGPRVSLPPTRLGRPTWYWGLELVN